ncbi:hypothetical protein THRCLA_01399 [Thraustotheca clavata]|uniref:Uncharacterized protein n=1 Tax=Thraustotheca clavata TaxID=74557 RepID=A0A1W0A8D8_9STRA|nr:hypothetical protein THRCLA_01399 [Thraustotheca clavata]
MKYEALRMEARVEKALETARESVLRRYTGNKVKKHPRLAHAAWQCHSALDGLRRSTTMSLEDAALVHPVSKDQIKNDTEEGEYEERIQKHVERYKQHFNHGLNALSSVKGTTKLSYLIDTAVAMQKKCRYRDESGNAVGVAVLSRSGQIYTASTQDPSLDVCPEKLAMLKLTSEDNDCGIEGCAISSSDDLFFPYPCGLCREFLAQFGNFPIYLIRNTLEYEKTTSFTLFPQAQKQPVIVPRQAVPRNHVFIRPRTSLSPKVWGLQHVLDWLIEDVGLPEYVEVFELHNVDGSMLNYMEESDFDYLLHISNPLHRKRIGLCLDRLHQSENTEGSVDFGQLKDYLAVLDIDRINIIAKLKQAFDAADQNKDGALSFEEIKLALKSLDYTVNATQVEAWIQRRSPESRVSFAEFALAFCSSWTTSQPILALPIPKIDLVAIRQTFERVDTNNNDIIEKADLIRALEKLGRTDCEAKAQEWLDQVDIDGSGTISFAEFILRYTQLNGFDIAPFQKVFNRIAKDEIRCKLQFLSSIFEELYVRYDKDALSRYIVANEPKTSGLTLAESLLVYFLFVQEPEHVTANEEYHKHHIVQLQQSGHVRLCTKPPSNSPVKLCPKEVQKSEHEKPSKLMQYRQAQKHRAEGKDDDDEEDESKLSDEFAEIHETFKRFQAKRLTTPEAIQALTELGIVLPRSQVLMHKQKVMLEYFTRHDFGTLREITYADLVRSYQELRRVTPSFNKTKKHRNSHVKHAKIIEAMLNGEYGKPFTRQELDAYYRQKYNNQKESSKEDDDDDTPRQKRVWENEINRLNHQHRKRQNKTASKDSDGDDDEAPRQHRRAAIGDRIIDKTRNFGPGTIIRLYPNYSVCDVHFDSGLKRRNIDLSCLRRYVDKPLATFKIPFEKGDNVNVKYKGTKLWRRGKIRKCRPHNEYDIEYSNDELEKHVPVHNLRKATLFDTENEKFTKGSKVHARTRESSIYMAGRIVKCRGDGTYDVRFQDDKTREKLPAKWIRIDSAKDEEDEYEGEDEEYEKDFEVGDIVEARYNGKDKYFKGKIIKHHSDGSFDIEYDNGEEETRVKKSHIRAYEVVEQVGIISLRFSKGDKVQARCGGKEKFYDGIVLHVHKDKSLDIEYNDGDEERRVDPKLVRKPTAKFTKGDRIEARFGGKDKYFKGKIIYVHSDSTLDIEYDDGDEERRVNQNLVRATETKSASIFHKGDKVEAQFGGKDKYFLGEISRIHSDGTLDIVYDDGDNEERVKPHLVRAVEASYEYDGFDE